mmetsp:Transcript_110659/g.191820  ORF Transcript_110659/g.191820 Transcript_110659/m.191820 type:complete len:321 (-) Transcript_110659:96-1058(-)
MAERTPCGSEARRQFPGIDIHLVQSDVNLKFHGRFLLPPSFTAEFSCLWDDNILPGRRLLETSRKSCRGTGGALIGGNGRFIRSLKKQGQRGKILEEEKGDYCKERVPLTKVDYVGHSWFFPTDHVRYMWDFPWLTWRTGEDMQFSFVLQRHNISSYVAAQPTTDECAHVRDMGKDKFASWHIARSTPIRAWLTAALLRIGFKTLRCKDCSTAAVVSTERFLWSKMIEFYKKEPGVIVSQLGHEEYFEQWSQTGAPMGQSAGRHFNDSAGRHFNDGPDVQHSQLVHGVGLWKLGLLLLLMVHAVVTVLLMMKRLIGSNPN